MVAAAIVGSAVVGGVAASSAARSQASAARSAANAQTQAADQATQFQRDAANYSINASRPQTQAQSYLSGLRLAGLGVPTGQVNQYMSDAYSASLQNLPDGSSSGSGGGRLEFDSEGQPINWNPSGNTNGPVSGAPQLGEDFNFSDFYRSTPGYQSGLDAQQSALERRAAAGGDYFSGDLVTQSMRDASDYEDRNYWNYWNNLGNAFTPGSTSGSDNASNVAINFGNSAATNATNAGNARATGYQQVGAANANAAYGWGNAITGAVGAWGGYNGWWGKT